MVDALSLIQATVEPGQGSLRLCTIEFPLNPGREPDHEETETEKESREWREHDSAVAMRKELVAVFTANRVEVEATQPECDDDVWKVDVHVKSVSPKAMVTTLVSGIDKLYRTWAGRAFHGDRFTEHKINAVKLTRDLTQGSEHYVHATVEPTHTDLTAAIREIMVQNHNRPTNGDFDEHTNNDHYSCTLEPLLGAYSIRVEARHRESCLYFVVKQGKLLHVQHGVNRIKGLHLTGRNAAELQHNVIRLADKILYPKAVATVEPASWQADVGRVARAHGLQVADEWPAMGNHPAGITVEGHIVVRTQNYPTGRTLALLVELSLGKLRVHLNDAPILLHRTSAPPATMLSKILQAAKALTTTRTPDVIAALEAAVR